MEITRGDTFDQTNGSNTNGVKTGVNNVYSGDYGVVKKQVVENLWI